MRMILTAGLLCAALFLAVINAVQAQEAEHLLKPSVTPVTIVGE